MRADVWVCVKLKGKSLKKNSFSFNFQKTSLKKFLPYIFFSREISCKKIKNHLQFCVKILLKKISSIFTGKSLVKFFQNHTLENIFQKLSPRGCFSKFSKIFPTCPKFNTHKKIVVHFFIPMLLLPLTPPLIYLKLKRFKGPKMDSPFFTSLFTFAHNQKGRR